MEVRVYKDGETKRLELRNTAAKNDQQFIDLNEFRDITVSIVGEQISIKRKSELIVRSDPSNFKDKDGGSLGNSPRIVADKIEAIISNRKEVDSYVIGSDLSEKSSETIFTHNKAGTDGLGGRLIVDNDEAKLDITRSTGQGETSVTVSAENLAGADRGTITGRVAFSNSTQDAFTVQGGNPGLGAPQFTINGRLIAENGIYVGSGGGTELAITDLDKVPASLGSTGQVLAVNSARTALEFVDQTGGGGSSTLLGLTDTPSGFGSSGQVLVVNAGRTAMEFATPLQIGTTATTALAGNTTTITTSQALAINANSLKTSFPGFGTTAGTALEGNTSLFDGAYSSLTGVPSTFTPSSHTHVASDITDFDTEVSNNASVVANTAKVSADGLVTTHSDVTSAGSGAIITAAERTKLNGIEESATANSTDAVLLNRANHTGTQAASTISDFDTEVSNNASVVANTAKNSFPGFGTSAGTALEGNTVLFDGAYSSLTGTPTIPSDIGDLSDVPASLGTSGQVLAVNSGGTALEYVDQSGGVSSVESLTGDLTLNAGTGISISDNGSDTITISSTTSGGTTTTVHYARMSMSSAVLKDGASQQNFTSPTDVDIQFDTEDDVNGTDITTNTSDYSMTVSTAGYYRLTCNMSFYSTAARITPGIRFNVNGSNIPGESMGYIRAANGQNENTNNLTRVIELAANDEITVCAHDESTVSGNIYAEQAIFEVEKLEVSVDTDFSNITNTPTTLAGYGITDSLQLGTTSTTALAGDTTTITSAQASAITANTAKTSFPGFGTTAGTALEGNTSLFDGAYTSLTGVPSTFTPSSHTHTASEITDFDTEVSNNSSVVANTAKTSFPGFGTTAGTALEGDTVIENNHLIGQKLEFETKGSSYGQGWEGTIVKYGTDTVQAGKAYVYTSSGWTAVDADNENKTKGLFGMALGTDADVDGLLVRGIWTSTLFSGYSAGDTLYISLTEGAITNSISSHTTGDFVRVVGYALGSNTIYLDPSPDYIEIA